MSTVLFVSGIVAIGFIGGVIGRKIFGENCNKIIDYQSDEETVFNFRCTEVHVNDSNNLQEKLLSPDKNMSKKQIITPQKTNINYKTPQTGDYKMMDPTNRFKNDVY